MHDPLRGEELGYPRPNFDAAKPATFFPLDWDTMVGNLRDGLQSYINGDYTYNARKLVMENTIRIDTVCKTLILPGNWDWRHFAQKAIDYSLQEQIEGAYDIGMNHYIHDESLRELLPKR